LTQIKKHNDLNVSPSLGDVLIISGDQEWAGSAQKILNANFYNTTIAFNGGQAIGHLEKTLYALVLIDLDSIDVPEEYLARKIKEVEPYIPIIGLGRHGWGPCHEVTYLTKPFSSEIIKRHFLELVSRSDFRVMGDVHKIIRKFCAKAQRAFVVMVDVANPG
jgi:DNA-binding NtrC family response regulator